ncbi:EAL domain-containing protein [Bradyrhizobium sp. 143]|nr:EAL domain-containing protein [Bradyrhizobium sp. 143]MCK1724478.1 EAL domain-containing protein [Bradyrhizobium sp. 142]
MQVAAALAASGLAPDRLELEVTESVLMQDTSDTIATLHQLREFGVRLAMDDFGTGYSSLSYLRTFPFDKIKIDKSFIDHIFEKEDCVTIVQAVTMMAQRLGMTTVAEGVETDDQWRKVTELGCTEMQGYLISRPQPAHELMRLLLERTWAMSAA